MMRTYRLETDLPCYIARPVMDMAAFFDFHPRYEAEASLKIVNCGGGCAGILTDGEKTFASGEYRWSENVSGEVTRCVKLAVLEVFSKALKITPALPWGVLTGVRPDKLAHKLVDGGAVFEDLPRLLERMYLVPPKQGRLLAEICRLQKQVAPQDEAGVYIGVPFCPSKCSYCSFPSGIVPRSEEEQQNFLNFIEQDIKNVVELLGVHKLKVTSLYIGGGTPTSLSEACFARLLALARPLFELPGIKEFTVEAGRPDCFTAGKLAAMEAAGVNRISVNPQTLHDKTLRLIGRRHTVDDFYRAYAMAAQSGIPVINTDLIIGLPGETAADISYSLRKTAELAPQNLTIHTLTLKKSSALFGSEPELNPKQAEELVREGMLTAAKLSMRPYYLYRQHYMLGHLANIGYALPGTESLYNIQMMEERHTIIGIGPCAATKVPLADGHHIKKLNMPKNIFTYTENLQRLAAQRLALFEEQEELHADNGAERH